MAESKSTPLLQGKIGRDIQQALDEDSDSESSSSSSDSDDEKGVKSVKSSKSLKSSKSTINAPYAVPQLSPRTGAADIVDQEAASARATGHWKVARLKVVTQAKVKKTVGAMFGKVRHVHNRRASGYMFLVVFLSVMETETKSAAFHQSAVGKYSIDGKPYQFKYSMFVTLGVFIMKLLLAPVHSFFHKKKHHKTKKKRATSGDVDTGPKTCKERLVWLKDLVMPWLLLVSFTLLNVASTSLANFGLTLTPTSIFVVCKTTKILFVAVMSVVLLGTRLKCAQWVSMLVLSAGLLLAVFGDKGAKDKSGDTSALGPILLIASEALHATMLIAQQYAIQEYWPDAIKLVAWSAAVGIPATISSMWAASTQHQSAPPYEPINDFGDVFVMCSNSPALGISLTANLLFHVAMDVSHMVCLRYMSSLSRSLADAIKLAVMWILGKVFWMTGKAIWKSDFTVHGTGGTIAVLAEPFTEMWWLMIPALLLIAHSMLMFKYKTYFPLQIHKDPETDRWGLQLIEDVNDNDPHSPDTGMDDTFYTNVFKNSKARKNLKKLWRNKKKDLEQKVLEIRKAKEKAMNSSNAPEDDAKARMNWKLAGTLALQKKEAPKVAPKS